jgi:hypothetical protein
LSKSNILPLLEFGLEFCVASLKSSDVVKLPLPGVTSGKSIARTLQSHFVGGVDGDWRERTLSTTGLGD